MDKAGIIEFITQNSIDKNSQIVFSINEKGQQIEYSGRIEFNHNGTPAITDDKIGIRVQLIKDVSDMPYVGGLLYENLINLRTDD